MTISFIINVDKDIIQIHDDKDIKLFSKNLINKLLEAYKCVCSPKNHSLILKVAISSPQHGLLLISFVYYHLMVCTNKIELDKPPSLS